MWKGDFLKAGVEANGFDINVYRGNIYARNFPGSTGGSVGMVFGETAQNWYVDGSVTASGNGETWSESFKTITEALAAVGINDVIYIAPSSYDEGAVLTVDTDGIRMVGAGDWTIYTSWITNSTDHPLVNVTADNVVFANLELYQTEANVGITVSGVGFRMTNCNVDGTGTGTNGIVIEAPWNLVEHCTIYNWVTNAVLLDDDYCTISGNIIESIAGANAINYNSGTGDFTRIIGNILRGVNSTDTGIVLAAGTTADELTISSNNVENFAIPVTINLPTPLYDGNFWGKNDADYHSVAGSYFVDSGVGATGDGRCWISAYQTILEAIADATTRNDTIYVKPGDYDEGGVINLTTQGLQIIGMGNKNDWQNKAMVWDAGGNAAHLMTINNHEILIDNLAFSSVDNGYDAIRVATTTPAYKVTIENCRFDGWSGEHAIYADSVHDSPDLVIRNNTFRSWDTAAIRVNVTRALIEGNVIILEGATVGVMHVPTGGNRPDTTLLNNNIFGVMSGDTGVQIVGTPTEALFHMSGNHVIGCVTPVTLSKHTNWYDDNYWGKEDWRYHPDDGREAAIARGAYGNIFYVDLNMAVTGLDGRCWASAFDTVAAGLLAADNDIAANRNWAHRNTVYAMHDAESFDLTLAAEKTDLVGLGSDLSGFPTMNHFTIGVAVNGFRVFNYGFIPTGTTPLISVPSGMQGFELHDVTVYKSESYVNTAGVLITNCRQWVMDNVRIKSDAGGARNT